MKPRDGFRAARCSAAWFRGGLVLAMLAFSGISAFGQYVDASVQLPTAPVPGLAFHVRVLINGASALQVEAVEPMYEGPVHYTGADVRPVPQPDGPAAYVDYHFIAYEEGSLVLSSLSVLYDGSPIQVGSWHVAIGSGIRAGKDGSAGNDVSTATWMVPGTVWMYEAFLARVVLPGGSIVNIPSLAIPGAVARPSLGGQGWSVIGTREGELDFPALEFDAPQGRVRVAGRRVRVQALPRAVAATRAVGTWSVSLKVDAADGEVRPGDSASWEAVARGDGSAGFAEPPTVRVFDPAGRPVALLATPFRFGQAVQGEASFTGHAGAIGTFVLELPGKYRVELEPYPWFDPASAQLRYARATPVTIRVVAPAVTAWIPRADLKAQAVATARHLAESKAGLWVQALAAIEADDPEGISMVYGQLAVSRPEARGGRLPWKWTGPGGFDQGMASLAFLGDDPVRAFHEAARLERWSSFSSRAKAFADAAAVALDVSQRPKSLMPAPMILGSSVALMVLLATMLLIGPLRRVSLLRLAGFMTAGLAVIFLVALALSIAERGEVYFVSVGGSAMAVPSAEASVSFEARPGSVGTVLRRIPSWAFVEFLDGRHAWIVDTEIYLY